MKNFEILLVKGRSFLNVFDWLIPRKSSYYGIDRFPVASKYWCPQDVSFKLFLVVLVELQFLVIQLKNSTFF